VRPLLTFAVVASVGIAGRLAIRRVGRRSGVSDADLVRSLPGDDLVPSARLVTDHAAVLDAPREAVWPWIEQLGKGRGNWYIPSWLERMLPCSARGAGRIEPRYLGLSAGDVVPDYGPGGGTFKVALVDPPAALVYYSVREPALGWRWPEPQVPLTDKALVLSWALVLEGVGKGHTRLYIRLRADRPARRCISPAFRLLGGFVDWVTISLLFVGLQERLRGKVAAARPEATVGSAA
jgi:hypothetical protein